MTPDYWARVDALLDEALALPPAEREAFLQRSCADNPELRAEVGALLAAYDQSDEFLETPAMDQAAKLLAEDLTATLVGRTLGRYRLLEKIGAGGMGVVYRAEDQYLKRAVAVKALPSALAKNAEAMARFEREARSIAALSHPNVVSIYDFGVEQGVPFTVMELLTGETLRARLNRGDLPWREAVRIMSAVAGALAATHAAGLIHRDIKPENIFVCADGSVRVLDFGIARVDRAALGAETDGPHTTLQTAPGMVLGTEGYLSPEQARARRVTASSDIFSLGCVVYEMLQGRQPFLRETQIETMAAITHEEPPYGQLASKIPGDLIRILQACLKKDPSARIQNGRELCQELERLRESRGFPPFINRRYRRLAWLALSLLLLLGVLAISIYHYSSDRTINSLPGVRALVKKISPAAAK
jgi:serine/threonine protein kinase